MKVLVYLNVIIYVLLSCSVNENKNLAVENNKEIILNMIDAYNNAEWEKMEAYYADTIEFFNPVYRQEPYKRAKIALRNANKNFAKNTIKWSIDIMSIYSIEDKVIVEMDYTHTNIDSVFNREFICTIFTIENDKIVKDAAYYHEKNAI